MASFKLLTVFVLVSIGSAFCKLPECPEGDEEALFPSDTNCSEYFQCVHGVPVVRECPDGLQWDKKKNICNWPDQISPPCTADCPSQGWLRRDRVNNCYLFGTEKMNFAEATQFCEDNGGKLAEPRRMRETNVINKMISKEAGGSNYWIGLTDAETEGTFTWESDNSEVGYSNWNWGQPNNAWNMEDCAMLQKGLFSYKWSDSNCDGRYSMFTPNTALCQKF